MAQAIRTIDHEEIREWVEARGGLPSVVEGTHDELGSGILRVDFGEREESLDEISWDEFFRIFDTNDLAFVYEEMAEDGSESYVCKFVARTEESDLGNYAEDVEHGDDMDDVSAM